MTKAAVKGPWVNRLSTTEEEILSVVAVGEEFYNYEVVKRLAPKIYNKSYDNLDKTQINNLKSRVSQSTKSLVIKGYVQFVRKEESRSQNPRNIYKRVM